MKQYITIFLIFICAHYFVACASYYEKKIVAENIPEKLDNESGSYIFELVLLDGSSISINQEGQHIDTAKRRILGITSESAYASQTVNIAIDSILYVKVRTVDVGGMVVKTLGILAIAGVVVVLIALASKQCCPFIYSYDGSHYIFDAEPLGGAICEGLERTDLSPLHSLLEINGEYRILIKNEVPETQRIDEMKLVVVDHSPSKEVIPDPYGILHLINPPVSPSEAKDENGNSLLRFISNRDGIVWQTNMNDYSLSSDLHHEITVKFVKPKNTDHTRLVVNMGTALWGSKMIKTMLMLRGDSVQSWYKSVNEHAAELYTMGNFLLREELYFLKVKVKEDGKWVEREIIPATGPFLTEDRTLPLDLSGVNEDTVEIKLDPPCGFWQIDYIGLTSGMDSVITAPNELPIASYESSSKSIADKILSAQDSNRYVMPDIGDWLKLSFKSPSLEQGRKRAIFMKTRGYYDIHLPKGEPEDRTTIDRLLQNKGAILEYSRKKFLEWKISNTSDALEIH